jgi:hypothetical protein
MASGFSSTNIPHTGSLAIRSNYTPSYKTK